MTRHTYVGAALLAVIAAGILHNDAPTPVHAQSSDPCATATSSAAEAQSLATKAPSVKSSKTKSLDRDNRWSPLDSLWAHRAAASQKGASARSVAPAPAAQDLGEIAVIKDNGELVIAPNTFDLIDAGLRLTPNAGGGYDVSRTTYGFRQPVGSSITLADDDAREMVLPFAFSFFGRQHERVFVNSDGNITFDESDTASSARSISRFLSGPPRVAPLFTDLDPSASGSVVTFGNASAFSITWCGVREYGTPRTATVQATLFAGGEIDIHVSSWTTVREAVVGVSPGHTTEFLPVDLAAEAPSAGGSAAVGERFTSQSDLDAVGVSRRFLETHPDEFDNIVIFTDVELLTDAFAYEITIANQIQGLNLAVFDYSSEYGSGGRLQSLCNMDALSKYPDDPLERFFGANSTVSVMGQEVGHRWLAYLPFRNHNGQASGALLGRDASHWSFFFDSDASVMEGNDIADLGGGAFQTVAAVQRYSLLDQYAMGLVDKSQVPPFFYVQSPTNVVPFRTAASAPEVGVAFNGIRRDVTIDDVIAVVGARVPSAAESPRVHRQAFVYVISAGGVVEASAIEKLDRIRVAWDQFLSAATDSRMRAETRLSISSIETSAQSK